MNFGPVFLTPPVNNALLSGVFFESLNIMTHPAQLLYLDPSSVDLVKQLDSLFT